MIRIAGNWFIGSDTRITIKGLPETEGTVNVAAAIAELSRPCHDLHRKAACEASAIPARGILGRA